MTDLSGTCIGEDPVGIALKECLRLIIELRNVNRRNTLKRSDATLILGGGNEFFGSSDIIQGDTQGGFILNDSDDTVLFELLELRAKLGKTKSIYSLDSLDLIDPFLRALCEKSDIESVRTIVLASIKKFFTFQLINKNSRNYIQSYRKAVQILINLDTNLTSNQNENILTDIQIITLLNHIISTTCGDCLSDSLVYASLKKVLLIVCRRKVADKLKIRAEYILMKMTVRVFGKLKFMDLSAINDKYIDDEQIKKYFVFKRANNSSDFDLQEEELSARNSTESFPNDFEENDSEVPRYGLPVIIKYLSLIHSLIDLENKTEYTMQTQILGLNLINTMVELVGRLFLKHPKLLNMISDPIFKSLALIFETNSENIEVIEYALKTFVSIVQSLGWFLPKQIELTMARLFHKLLHSSSSELKTIIVEQLSLLWMNEPSLFIHFFIKYDCNLDYEDVSINFLETLRKLVDIRNNITICTFALDGLMTFVQDIANQIDEVDVQQLEHMYSNKILDGRSRKTEFIQSVRKFNERPKDGITMLIEKNFIPSNDDTEIATFLFENDFRINKKRLGLLLCHPDEENLLQKFISHFQFNGLRVDEALRVLLTKFRLPGESQQIERIIEAFSKRYVECQKYAEPIHVLTGTRQITDVCPDFDSVFVLSYSIVMLNTDLHNPQVKEHMTLEEYSSNLRGCYNGTMDYPQWFLQKIYSSIKDKEIVMPEEHHGHEKWFDDMWNNTISANTVITEIPKIHLDDIMHYTSLEKAQFEMKLFEIVGPKIVEKLFEIISVSRDDNTVATLMNSVEQCYKVSRTFKLKNIFNIVLNKLGQLTRLSKTLDSQLKDTESSAEEENINENTILIDILNEENNIVIPVSKYSINFGGSFKSRLSMILFFKIIGQNDIINFINSENWNQMLEIIFVMYENRMIINNVTLNNFYPDYNVSSSFNICKLKPLKADYTIEDMNFKSRRGLFSTFASYLKGDDEPTDEEINKAILSNDCIKNIKINQIWRNNTVISIQNIIDIFETHIPKVKDVNNFKYFENLILFNLELSMDLMISHKWTDKISGAINGKIDELYKVENLSKFYYQRLMTYRILLLDILNDTDDMKSNLENIIEKDIIVSNELFNAQFFSDSQDGKYIIEVICKRLDKDNDTLWKLLKYLNGISESKQGNLLKYVEDIKNYTSKNIQNILPIVNDILSHGENDKLLLNLIDILKGSKEFESNLETTKIISIIQIIIKKILLQENGEQNDEKNKANKLLEQIKGSLISKESILNRYDSADLKYIINNSLLTIFDTSNMESDGYDNNEELPFDSNIYALSKEVYLCYFPQEDTNVDGENNSSSSERDEMYERIIKIGGRRTI